MNDLTTIVRKNAEARRVHDRFVCALSEYGDAVKRGDAFGPAFDRLLGVAYEHQTLYNDTTASARLQRHVWAWTTTVGEAHYRSLRHPEVVVGSRTDEVL